MPFPLISFNCQVPTKYNVHLILAALLKFSKDFKPNFQLSLFVIFLVPSVTA